MSTSAMLEGIWNDFHVARKKESQDLDRMKMCLREFDLEYDSTKVDLPPYSPQKQMARRSVMVKAIERAQATEYREKLENSYEEFGSW